MASASELLLAHLATTSLPLVATTLATTNSPFAITGGTAGSKAGEGDYFYDSAEGILHIQTSAEMTLSTPAQTDSIIYIDPGVKAELTLDGVDIHTSKGCPIDMITNLYDTADGSAATEGTQILHPTSLYLKIADDSENSLWTDAEQGCGIHCGEGSTLIIDDALDNRSSAGYLAEVSGAKVTTDIKLKNGKVIAAGKPSSELDSCKPGKLKIMGGFWAAAIGSVWNENGGTLVFNGGQLTIDGQASEIKKDGVPTSGAGIGAGFGGDGTATIIVFNGGNITAHGGIHAAGVGACHSDHSSSSDRETRPGSIVTRHLTHASNVAGDILINGGFIKAIGGWHGGGFGSGCWSSNEGHTITVTGGTLIPIAGTGPGGPHSHNMPFPEIGGYGGHVIITGGSIRCTDPNKYFQGIGDTAWGNDECLTEGYNPNDPNDPNKVFMITIDLSSEIMARNQAAGIESTDLNRPVENWTLSIGNKTYPYGAPTNFDEGKLYLWLPKAALDQEVTVSLSYLDANGDLQEIDPLFRIPGTDMGGTTLKRYHVFDLPDDFENMAKPYDGLPLPGLVVDEDHPLATDDGRELTQASFITYKYQRYNAERTEPLGAEKSSAAEMPRNVGIMKLTADSTQYASDKDFSTSYWGHRATTWCEITPIPSEVREFSAVWAEEDADSDQRPGSAEHDSDRLLTVSAVIGRGETVDGAPLAADGSNATAVTCRAPQGRVQLYVDDQPVGAPLELKFDTKLDDNGDVETSGGRPVADNAGEANATVVPNGEGGGDTRFTWTFSPADNDWLLPTLGTNGTHEVSLRYLPPVDADLVPANYLASASPAEDEDVPRAEIDVRQIEPHPFVTPEDDPDKSDPDFPDPAVETGGGEHDDPSLPEDEPGDRTFHGTITTTWGEPTEANPHPGRVTLKVTTPSTAPISVTDARGNVFTAEFVKDENGEPVRDGGTYTLILDPTAVGSGELTFRQEANGAYTGSTWVYAVKVNPDASKAPEPALAKGVENLTHPSGPTQAGDRLRYTITAANEAAGSLWTGVTVTDPMPRCLKIVEGSARLQRADGSTVILTAAPAVGSASVGQYGISAPGPDGRRTLSVPVGDVAGDRSIVVTFECIVAVNDFAAATADELDLANVATASGTRPDPNDPDNPMPDPDDPDRPLPVAGGPTEPIAPLGPGRAVPADPDLAISKAVENLTRSDGTTHVGDRLRYTIAAENRGDASSVIWDAVIGDPLPTGLKPIDGSFSLALSDGATVKVPDGAYDGTARTVAVATGNLWGGQTAALTFECTVLPEAVGGDIANTAHLFGTPPADDPNRDPDEVGTDPGSPADVPSGEPEASSAPVAPSELIPDDPAAGNISLSKTAENASRDDGTTHVGDTVRYAIALENRETGTGWIDAVIRDDVPRGLEPVSGTITLTLPDGRQIAVDDAAYDPGSRILAVTCGRLYGGQKVVLAFDALVTADAVGADIGNVAAGYGALPSNWDFDEPEPEPGLPFNPPGGWGAWERDREKVVSEPAYAPGTDEQSGVILDEDAGDAEAASDKEGTTIAHKLAQTGDRGAAAALGLCAAATLAACALALASRRRERRAR